MNINDNAKKTNNEIKLNAYEQINPQLDKRVQMIYERYHAGKSIIMDDLQYLWKKDPEGCERLLRSIVEPKADKKIENELDQMGNIKLAEKEAESTSEQSNHLDDGSDTNLPIDKLKKVIESMNSIKLVIEKMSDSERMDLMKGFNEALELKKLPNKMKYWDDTFLDKMTMYTFEEEKEFNLLV